MGHHGDVGVLFLFYCFCSISFTSTWNEPAILFYLYFFSFLSFRLFSFFLPSISLSRETTLKVTGFFACIETKEFPVARPSSSSSSLDHEQ